MASHKDIRALLQEIKQSNTREHDEIKGTLENIRDEQEAQRDRITALERWRSRLTGIGQAWGSVSDYLVTAGLAAGGGILALAGQAFIQWMMQ